VTIVLWVRWNDKHKLPTSTVCANVSVAGAEVHIRPAFETECLHQAVKWDGM
jgi:hypothetical protein